MTLGVTTAVLIAIPYTIYGLIKCYEYCVKHEKIAQAEREKQEKIAQIEKERIAEDQYQARLAARKARLADIQAQLAEQKEQKIRIEAATKYASLPLYTTKWDLFKTSTSAEAIEQRLKDHSLSSMVRRIAAEPAEPAVPKPACITYIPVNKTRSFAP